MTKNNDELDYTSYYLKNFRDKDKFKRGNDRVYAVDNTQRNKAEITEEFSEIPRIMALVPDEIDSEPYFPPHKVEYIPQKAAIDKKYNVKKRNKPRNVFRNRGIALVLLTIIVCFGITLVIADSINNGTILDELQAFFTGANNDKSYYCVEINAFTDMNSAKVYSSELREIGGAGYVINDELYRVIADSYASRKDAESVVSKLNMNGNVARVYEIIFYKVNYSLFPLSVRNIAKTTMQYVDTIYEKMYAMVSELARGNLDKNTALTQLKNVMETLNTILIDFESNCDNELENKYVEKVRMQLLGIDGAISSIISDNPALPNLLSDVRYINVMLLNTHRALTKDLSSDK